MNFGDFEITYREILVSIAITLILIGIGFLISGSIENGINENNEKYYKALKIDNNEEIFKYAIKTNVGYTLSQGNVKAINGVSINDIEGTYFRIKKVKEKYTMHTRQVEHTRKVGNRTETYYTTEIYYTWDYAGQEEFNTEKFEFLGVQFEYGTINFHNEEYKETIKVSSDTRFNYYIIPYEFQGCLFAKIQNNTITENEFKYNNTIKNIIECKQKESGILKIIFWILWTILIFAIVFVFIYFENKYLED